MNTTAFSDFTSWKAHGLKLAQIHSDHQFEIARWMLVGEVSFGDQNPYDVAEEITGYARLTLQNWASVVRHLSIRIESLSFGHHQIVASLEPEQQKEWLELAAAEGLSVKKLAAAIQEARSASVELDGTATPEATAAATPRSRKPFTPDEQYKYLKFVPVEEADKLGLLALARCSTVEEQIILAIQQLNAAAADEIERQRDLEKQKSEASSRRWAALARQDAESRKRRASDKSQAESAVNDAARDQAESETEKPIVETAQPEAPTTTPQKESAPEPQVDTVDVGAMMPVESRLKQGLPPRRKRCGNIATKQKRQPPHLNKKKTARQEMTGESDIWKSKCVPLINW